MGLVGGDGVVIDDDRVPLVADGDGLVSACGHFDRCAHAQRRGRGDQGDALHDRTTSPDSVTFHPAGSV